jgi:hypothetical protein
MSGGAAQPEILARPSGLALGENDGVRTLIEEAMRKAAVAWLEVPGRGTHLSQGRIESGRGRPGSRRHSYPVWCLWVEDSLYVVSGPDEQSAPGLAGAATVLVSARGDHGGRIITWPARVSRVRPDSEEWGTVVPQLAAKRLNGPPVPELLERWARTAVVSRLTPTP